MSRYNIPISGSHFCDRICIENCYIYYNHVRPERMTRKKKMGNKSHIYSERRSSNIQDFPRSYNEQNEQNSSKEPSSNNEKIYQEVKKEQTSCPSSDFEFT